MNLKIRTRLILAFVVLIGLMSFVYYLGAANTFVLNERIDFIVFESSQKLLLSSQLAEDAQFITKREKDLILTKDKATLQELVGEVDQRLIAMNDRLEELKSVEDEGGREDVAVFEERWNDYLKVFKKIRNLAVTVNTDSSKAEAYELSTTTARETAAAAIEQAYSRVKNNKKELLEVSDDSDIIYADGKNMMLAALVTGILVALVMSTWIIVSIVNSINQANKAVQSISAGDLTVAIEVKNKDEVGTLLLNLKSMVEKLKDVIGSVTTAADNIASASQQMSGSSQQMSEGATEQAASAEEVSSSMEEMAANIQQNTDNAQQTEKIALQAAEDVQEGSKAVNQTVDSMKKIAEKITIIGEIARQTNLLALNAAVEAARAGEHGKGFAVVAAEVRRLAERSQLAANEINELSSTSVAIADKSGKLLEQIVPNIQKTARLVQEITAASLEQNAGAEQVNGAIQQLNQIIQQNAASAEEMASGSEELYSQADQLKDTVSFFNIGHQNQSRTSSSKKRKSVPVVHLNGNSSRISKKAATAKTGLQLELNGHDSMDSDFEKL
ncbi:methyl-accepting chemotaxis protein [Cesiribacter sp. SM1]|uniref:methyl-accepting chemotaxis protein n=1 Tax=Cesiribacter sp. SM1 TaxID=2861196 RepID=UPI001CD79C19|nr:methyl-accepting chemotaxis protein [Cesiribacter sp. SM1]